jgi:hypothetical protein
VKPDSQTRSHGRSPGNMKTRQAHARPDQETDMDIPLPSRAALKAQAKRFDAPIVVVTSTHFSSFRHRVNCVVEADGRSARCTSDGQPHLVIDDARAGG